MPTDHMSKLQGLLLPLGTYLELLGVFGVEVVLLGNLTELLVSVRSTPPPRASCWTSEGAPRNWLLRVPEDLASERCKASGGMYSGVEMFAREHTSALV